MPCLFNGQPHAIMHTDAPFHKRHTHSFSYSVTGRQATRMPQMQVPRSQAQFRICTGPCDMLVR